VIGSDRRCWTLSGNSPSAATRGDTEPQNSAATSAFYPPSLYPSLLPCCVQGIFGSSDSVCPCRRFSSLVMAISCESRHDQKLVSSGFKRVVFHVCCRVADEISLTRRWRCCS
ncbi:hypothetical protein ATANTOWER_022378, partial [Ataeniobius toweri]|nr:hypothetical protein [Ataeniobius toweri]